MATLGIDGLVSGLDTTSLINSLMQAEAAPQALLKTKQSDTTTLITALQALNAKVGSLGTAASTAADPKSWNAYAASSSSTSVIATAGATAKPATLTFRVSSVAASQVSLVDPAQLTGATAITIKQGSTYTTVTPASMSAEDVTAAINAATGSAATATTVRTGNGSMLQLSGTATGLSGAFQVYVGTQADVVAGTATAVTTASVRASSDASIVLFEGTSAQSTVSSSTNTFTGLLTGVDVTVAGSGPDPVTVSVARDDTAIKKLASGLVGSLGVVLNEITSRTASTTTTAADGSTSVTGGLFSGDSGIRNLVQQLSSAASYPVDGVSPSSVGIVLGTDGTFTFDDAKFSAAMAADPQKVQSMITGLAKRVADVAKQTSDPDSGSLSLAIKSQQTTVKELGDDIADWDRRLDMRRSTLQATYSALEVTLSGLKSQSSWLAGQLASLPSSS